MGSYSFLSCANTHFILPIMEAELESHSFHPWTLGSYNMTVHLIVKLALPIASTLGSLIIRYQYLRTKTATDVGGLQLADIFPSKTC